MTANILIENDLLRRDLNETALAYAVKADPNLQGIILDTPSTKKTYLAINNKQPSPQRRPEF